VAEFLVESFVSRLDADQDGVARRADRAREAAAAVNRGGATVRYVRSIFVPAEETAFFVYEAALADDVREAARRAAIEIESLVETITEPARAPDDRNP
jgi:hypothetical protein